MRQEDRYAGYSFPLAGGSRPGTDAKQSTWKLIADGSGGQMTISSLAQYFSTLLITSVQTPPVTLHAGQVDLSLPPTVVIDISHHNPT